MEGSPRHEPIPDALHFVLLYLSQSVQVVRIRLVIGEVRHLRRRKERQRVVRRLPECESPGSQRSTRYFLGDRRELRSLRLKRHHRAAVVPSDGRIGRGARDPHSPLLLLRIEFGVVSPRKISRVHLNHVRRRPRICRWQWRRHLGGVRLHLREGLDRINVMRVNLTRQTLVPLCLQWINVLL